MNERIGKIRQDLDEIRKSGKLPHWRIVYADVLLVRAQEYVLVDRFPEANRVIEKLERYILNHKKHSNENTQKDKPLMTFWNEQLLLNIVNEIKKTLVLKSPLIPSTERESINRRLKMVEQWIQKRLFLEAHEELLSLRSILIARLRRSYRARNAAVTAYRLGNYTPPEGSLVGLYNAQHTLEETFHIVGERDPIWIEDFLEIYNNLFKIVDKITPQEKNKL